MANEILDFDIWRGMPWPRPAKDGGESVIVKCQKPVYSNEKNPPVLIYNRERTFEQMLPYSDLWEELFDNSGLPEYLKAKFFAEVHVDRNILVVDKALTEDLGW